MEEHKLRTRLEHYQAKVKELENKHSDSNKLERNIAKWKDVESRYRNFTNELTKQMEICWKKHVPLFAEACIALWYTEFWLSAKLFESAEPLRPFIARHLQNIHRDSAQRFEASETALAHTYEMEQANNMEHQSPISEEAFGSLEYDSMEATNSQLERTHIMDNVWKMSSALNNTTSSSSTSDNSSNRRVERANTSNVGSFIKRGNSAEAYSVVSQSPQTNI